MVGMYSFDLDEIGTGLPVRDSLDELAAALHVGACVVEAPPGTGKTTLIPPATANLLAAAHAGDDEWAGSSRRTGGGASSGGHPDGRTPLRVVVTQPRRVAARAAASRLAALTGSRVGDLAGYTVRGERRVRAGTLVEFVTPGVLVRRLLSAPELPGVGAVILDEVHERSLESDLALAMLAELRQVRDGLAVVAMSATLDAGVFAGVLGTPDAPAPVVSTSATSYPLDVRWKPPAGSPRIDERGVTPAFLAHVAEVTVEAAGDSPEHDVLVFLPGVREVERVAEKLRARLGDGTEVLSLHGGLSPADQDRVISVRPVGSPRRVVVSTDVAESSLTVPGVRTVVDSGLSREPRMDSSRGMAGLVTVSESRESGEQRAGRAARLGPGTVHRCFAEDEWARMPRRRTPEIRTSDLTSAALDLACWGSPRGEGLDLPDPPPRGAIEAAERVLVGLGAVDADGRATERGRVLAGIPADPRRARALIDGAPVFGAGVVAEVVAALTGDTGPRDADLGRHLRELRSGGARGARAWRTEADRLERIAAHHASPSEGAPRAGDPVGAVVALAHPDRVARRRGDHYLLASGTGVTLPPGSPLSGAEWIVVAEAARHTGRAAEGSGALIRSAARIDEATAIEAAAALLREEIITSWDGRRVVARRNRRLGAIELSSTPVAPPPDAARTAVLAGVREHGFGGDGDAATGASGILPPSAPFDALRRRLAFLHHHLGEPWPDVTEAALIAEVESWLGPEIDELAGGVASTKIDATSALRRLLPWPEATRLDELAPERLTVASGNRARIEYPPVDAPGDRPVMRVKLQECFGWAEAPRLADGRSMLVFHLLSPAGRPLAVTGDLASFWTDVYPGVRAEMRGRYPRHPWPEDPWTATATTRTSRRT